MSKNKNEGNVATATATAPIMGVTPETVAQIATVATLDLLTEEQAAAATAPDKAARLEAQKAAEDAKLAKRLEKELRRQQELENSPTFSLCGERVNNVALERMIEGVNRESGRVRAKAREHGLLTVKEAADGKQALLYDTKAVNETVKAGYASKETAKDIAAMKKLVSSLVYFGLMPRPASFDADDEE